MARLQNRGEQSQTEKEFCEILQLADPIVSRFVSEHEAFRARNEALVKRVAVLERALERVMDFIRDGDMDDTDAITYAEIVVREALDG